MPRRLLGGSGQEGVQLRYDRVKQVKVVAHEPRVTGEKELFALYDEFDGLTDGTVTHSILMTGGIEIRVRCGNLVRTPFTRIVAPDRGRLDVAELEQALAC